MLPIRDVGGSAPLGSIGDLEQTHTRFALDPWAQRRDQSACPAGMNWKSSTGTCSKNAWCSLCGNGHKTGVGCWLVYQFLHPPTHTVPGNAAPRRARNISVAGTVGETTARHTPSVFPSRAREETRESRGMPCLFLHTERGFGGKTNQSLRAPCGRAGSVERTRVTGCTRRGSGVGLWRFLPRRVGVEAVG